MWNSDVMFAVYKTLCHASDCTRHGHLHGLQDAHPQERQNHPNLRRPRQLQETRIRKQDFAEVMVTDST